MRAFFVLPLLSIVFSASLVSAQITPISRTSTNSRSDGLSGDPSSFTTTSIESITFDPFDDSLFPLSNTVATQSSSFGNICVTASTELSNVGTSSFGSDFNQTFGSLTASSTFELVFSLPRTTDVSIIGTLSEIDPVEQGVGVNNGGAFLQIERQGGPVEFSIASDAFAFVTPQNINQFILLEPGTYTLRISSNGSGNQIEPVADSSADFTIWFFPANVLKGDVDQSGAVFFDDLVPFVMVLQSGIYQPEADIDCSGVVDFADIPAFIDLFRAQ